MAIDISERINAERLGIRCFNEIENKNDSYNLIPIVEWTKEICEELNKTDFSTNYSIMVGTDLVEEDGYEEKFSNLKKLKKPVDKVYVYSKLPVQYVRFHNTVILQSDSNIDEIVPEIESSVIKDLGIVSRFDNIKANLLTMTHPITWDNCDKFKDSLEDLKEICALSANFSMNKRQKNGEDNQIWYELLQNANDHIPSDSCKELKIIFNNDKTFTLEYPDNGFSVRDFLAMCTEGNSGNVLSDENREGRKGTGFKSVYNLFDTVTITSGPVQCVLKDFVRIINISKDEKRIIVTDAENVARSDEYYPIPEFKYFENDKINSNLNNDNTNKTKITFHSTQDLRTIKELIFGSYELSKEKIRKLKNDCLFLDNIEKISFSFEDGSGIEFNSEGDKYFSFEKESVLEFKRGEYIRGEYFKKEYTIDSTDIQKDSNPNWKDRNDDLFTKKKKVTFLFPKNTQGIEKNSESRVYCTLPIDGFSLKVPFTVNIPLLELNDDRKNLANHTRDKFSLNEWNKKVLTSGLMCGFKHIVESDIDSEFRGQESGNNENVIGLSNWYKYFPYEYLKQNEIFGISWSDLQNIKFIRTTTSTEEGGKNCKAAAISDLVQNENDLQNKGKSIFLPCNMYSWLHQNTEDVFESTESEDKIDYELQPVLFVYYDCIQKETEDTVEDLIKERMNSFDFSKGKLYLRKQGEPYGKILLELKEYLFNDYKKDVKDTFYVWLKKLLEDKEFCFEDKNVIIYKAYFKTMSVDYKNGKYHWLEFENRYYDDDIDNYRSINKTINRLKEALYGSKDHCLQNEEMYSIKACFADLVESPYIKYIYEKANCWNSIPSLRVNDILPTIEMKEKRKDIKEVLCYYSKKLIESNLPIGSAYDTVGWFKKNRVLLYVKNTMGGIIEASETVYYVEQNIDIKNDFLVNYGGDFFYKLKDALGKDGDFFSKNEGNQKFIEQIIEAYDVGIWKEQAQTYIKAKDSNKDIKSIVFRSLIKKSEEPVEWHETYKELIKECSISDLWKINDSAVFNFNENCINKLPRYVLDVFDNKVSFQEKAKIADKNLGKSLQEIVKNDIYVLPCEIGHKSLYCKVQILEKDQNKELYALFSEKSFGTLLRKQFECFDFSENKIYDTMQCNDIDGLIGSTEQESDGFIDEINSKAGDLVEKWTGGEKEELKKALVARFDVKNKEKKKWFHARGYGNEKYTDRKCPVCRGILLSEMNALTVRNITCKIQGQKYYFPMLMCNNCGEAINYTETVELEIPDCGEDKEDFFGVGDNSFKEYTIIFSMNGREEKEFRCKVSFLNRYIWKLIKNNDDETRIKNRGTNIN